MYVIVFLMHHPAITPSLFPAQLAGKVLQPKYNKGKNGVKLSNRRLED